MSAAWKGLVWGVFSLSSEPEVGVRKLLPFQMPRPSSRVRENGGRPWRTRAGLSVSYIHCLFISQTFSGLLVCTKESPVQSQVDTDSCGRSQASIRQSSFTRY